MGLAENKLIDGRTVAVEYHWADGSPERLQAPKIAWVAPAAGHSDNDVLLKAKPTVDLSARTISMGKLHHAITGTGAVAIAMAAAVPGTVDTRPRENPW